MLNKFRAHWLSLSYLLLIAALISLSFYLPVSAQYDPPIDIPNPADVVLKLIDKLTTLAAGLNTALVATTVAITFKGTETSIMGSRVSAIAVMVVFVSAAISYFGIYLGYVRLIEMVSTPKWSAIDPVETEMVWAVRMQFWGIVSEAIAIGFLLIRILEDKVESTFNSS